MKYFKFCYILTNCRSDTFTLTKPPRKTSKTMYLLKIFSYILINYILCYIREMLKGATQWKKWGREDIENSTFAIDTPKTSVSITRCNISEYQQKYIYIFKDHKQSTDSFFFIYTFSKVKKKDLNTTKDFWNNATMKKLYQMVTNLTKTIYEKLCSWFQEELV